MSCAHLVADDDAGSQYSWLAVCIHPGALRQLAGAGRHLPGGSAPRSGPSSPTHSSTASWTHLGVNALWFLPFGSAVARRFGAARFLAFFAVTAAAGALAHLFTHGGETAPVIGASAAISGTMAAAMRFAFQRGGPLGFRREQRRRRLPRAGAAAARRAARSARADFLVVWFGINLLFGLGSLPIAGDGQPVAWQAHIGGFLAGLLLFSLVRSGRPSAAAIRA